MDHQIERAGRGRSLPTPYRSTQHAAWAGGAPAYATARRVREANR